MRSRINSLSLCAPSADEGLLSPVRWEKITAADADMKNYGYKP